MIEGKEISKTDIASEITEKSVKKSAFRAGEVLDDVDPLIEMLENPDSAEAALTQLKNISGKQVLHLQPSAIEKLFALVDPELGAFQRIVELSFIVLEDVISSNEQQAMEIIMNPGYLEAFVVHFYMIESARCIELLIKKNPKVVSTLADFGLFQNIIEDMKTGEHAEACVTCIASIPDPENYQDFMRLMIPFLLQFISSENDNLKSISMRVLQNCCRGNEEFTSQMIENENFEALFSSVEDDLQINELLEFLTAIDDVECLKKPALHEFIMNSISSCLIETIRYLYSKSNEEGFGELIDQDLYSILLEVSQTNTNFEVRNKSIIIICNVLLEVNPDFIDHEVVIELIEQYIDSASGVFLETLVRTIIGLVSSSTVEGTQERILESETIRAALENIASNPSLIDNEEILAAIDELLKIE